MRKAARSARSTRQQLRPGSNRDARPALDEGEASVDCRCNSDWFCNFLATFIVWSRGELQIECPFRLAYWKGQVLQWERDRDALEQRTRLSGVRQFVLLTGSPSPRRPTAERDTAYPNGGQAGLSLAPAFSTDWGVGPIP